MHDESTSLPSCLLNASYSFQTENKLIRCTLVLSRDLVTRELLDSFLGPVLMCSQ